MDNPVVTTQRERPPSWARDSRPVGSVDPKISPAQRSYLLDLIQKKQVKPDQEGKIDQIMKCLRISEDPEEYGMGKKKASELIDWFLKQPDKPKNASAPIEKGSWLPAELPAGRYALPKSGTTEEQNEIRFYQCWESPDKKVRRIYVCHGPYDSKLPIAAQVSIARLILQHGVRECAIRWGLEIRSCSNCGRRLTNRISRELGIGPICGGRMFGDDDWKNEVKAKRQEILARGEDPDEELGDD